MTHPHENAAPGGNPSAAQNTIQSAEHRQANNSAPRGTVHPDGAKAPARRGRGKSEKSLALIAAARESAERVQPITVRGIAYKLFATGHVASMSRNEVARVSRLLTDAREQGIIPWAWLVDESRGAERVNTWSSPEEIISAAVQGYRRDYWADQPEWVEVWSEKGTVRGVLRPVLDALGVTFRVMHGFGSATAINDIAAETRRADKPLTIFYTGDWDPSGLFMSESDLPGRISRYGGSCRIERIALTAEDLPGLPSFEAATKARDPRHHWFTSRYDQRCFELDAMDPGVLRARVESAIKGLIDVNLWNRAVEVEAAEVESMRQFHAAWSNSRQDAKYSGWRP